MIDLVSRRGLALRGKRLSHELGVSLRRAVCIGSAFAAALSGALACLLVTGCEGGDGGDGRAGQPLAADTAPMLPGTRGTGASSPEPGKNAGAQQFDTSGGTLAARDPNGPLLPPVMHTAE